MNCGVGPRQTSYLALLWLWCTLVATAPIRPLAWEPPHATGAALKQTNKKKQNRNRLTNIENNIMIAKGIAGVEGK